MVDITRGDVLLCDLNPVVGTEQAGITPVVVVQAKAGFACIAAYFIKRLVKINIFEFALVKLEFAQ